MTAETKQKIADLKEECDLFHEQVSRKMNDLCNFGLDYKEGSCFSHVLDRLDLFMNDFNSFYHWAKMSTKEIITTSAANAVNYWERNKSDSGIFVEFKDFDKIEVSISEGFDGGIDEAVESVKTTLFNAHI